MNNSQPNIGKTPWIILGVIYIASLFTFLYHDIWITTIHGVNLWNSNFWDFYVYNNAQAVYPFPIYIIFAVWNFPIWICTRFLGMELVSYETYIFWIWAKLILLPFIYGSAYYTYQICKELKFTVHQSLLAVFLFLSSLIFIFPTVVIAQYDIISLFFTLMGVYALLQNKEKGFILWFAVAIVMKNFPIFIFIPLLLLTEKNYYKIALKGLIVIFPYIIFTMFPYYKELAGYFSKNMLLSNFDANLFTSFSGVSIWLVSYILICVLAFIQPIEDLAKKNRWIIYLSALSIVATLSLRTLNHYYWFVLTVPFVSILIMQNIKHINLLIILESVGTLGLTLWAAEKIYWFFNRDVINSLGLFPKIFSFQGSAPYNSLADLIPNGINHIFASLYFACMLAIFLLCIPKKDSDQQTTEIIDKNFIYMRLAFSVILLGGIYFMYFYHGKPL
ncbi:MAG: hypothetical protein ACRC9L_07490 [Brevinema sp.]